MFIKKYIEYRSNGSIKTTIVPMPDYSIQNKPKILKEQPCEFLASSSPGKQQLELALNEISERIKLVDPDKPPGKVLLEALNKGGYLAKDYRKWLKIAQSAKTIRTYYKPQTKIAVLIANDKYKPLPKLASPSQDCDTLNYYLKNLGFVVFKIKNVSSEQSKLMLEKVFEAVPENSYCFIFYAGHGFEICNTRCTLDISSPDENITMDHCITENFILQAVAKCKPELCVLFMDMCRMPMDRELHPQLYKSITSVELPDTDAISKLLISYSTAPNEKAYELCQIEVDASSDSITTVSSIIINSGDSERIKFSISQYIKAFCTRIREDLDISSLIDSVHRDLEGQTVRRQTPMKLQWGVAQRSLYDHTTGDTKTLYKRLKKYCELANDELKKTAYNTGIINCSSFGVSSPNFNVETQNIVFLTPDVARVTKEC